MAPTSPPTFRRRRLGGALRRLREERGLTQQEAADQIGYRIDRISRAEMGRTKIEVPLLRALLDVYGVDDAELRSALEDMARNVSQRGWWHSYASFLHLAFQDFLGLEHDARRVQTWQTMLIPGLLQTEDYARTLLEAGNGIVHTSPERIAKLVSVRMERKKALVKEEPLHLSAIISEAALHDTIGNTTVMRAQIEHLAEAATKPNIDLRIMPLDSGGPHVGLDGPFTLFSFPDGGELASLEALVNSFYLEEEESVAAYSRAFEQLSTRALDQEATLTHLAQMTRAR